MAAVVALVVVAGAGVGAWLRFGSPDASHQDEGTSARLPAQDLAVLAWSGKRSEVAVVASGGGRHPVALVFPPNLVVNVPGHGTGRLEEAVADGAGAVQTAVANLLGIGVGHRGMLTADGLVKLAGPTGFQVDLGAPARIGGRSVGPGPGDLSAAEIAAYLDARRNPVERLLRWEEVLPAILSASGGGSAMQVAAQGDDPGFGAAAGAAAGATVEEFPSIDAGEGVAVVDRAAAERVVQRLFPGAVSALARVVVLNGNGVPGIGEQVARMIVPGGFRVVASGNARAFDVTVTQIVVVDPEFLAAGRRLRSLLGVGDVSVGTEPSGVADIAVVVGKDFA